MSKARIDRLIEIEATLISVLGQLSKAERDRDRLLKSNRELVEENQRLKARIAFGS